MVEPLEPCKSESVFLGEPNVITLRVDERVNRLSQHRGRARKRRGSELRSRDSQIARQGSVENTAEELTKDTAPESRVGFRVADNPGVDNATSGLSQVDYGAESTRNFLPWVTPRSCASSTTRWFNCSTILASINCPIRAIVFAPGTLSSPILGQPRYTRF